MNTPKFLILLLAGTLSLLSCAAQKSTLIVNTIKVKDSFCIGGKCYAKLPDSTGGGGIGDTTALMRKGNNLADVTDVSQARVNLGFGNIDNTSDYTKDTATAELTHKTIDGTKNTFLNIPAIALPGFVPPTRTITINGQTFDLSSNRSWTITATDTAGSATYAGLTDVSMPSLSNAQLPRWNGSTMKWNNFTPGIGDITAWSGYKPLSPTDTLDGANHVFLHVPFSALNSLPSTMALHGITDGVTKSTTLTINGQTYDLSANRSWTIAPGVTSFSALSDVLWTSLSGNQLPRYNATSGKWNNFTPGIGDITSWAGYKPLAPADTLSGAIVTGKRLADSLAQTDTFNLKRPLYFDLINGQLAVKNDSAAWHANALGNILLPLGIPANGQGPVYDSVSGQFKWAATAGAVDLSASASDTNVWINPSSGKAASIPLATPLKAGAESPTEHVNINRVSNFYNSWQEAGSTGASVIAYGTASPDSIVFRALAILNTWGITWDTTQQSRGVLRFRGSIDTAGAFSSRAYRQKGIDSLAAAIATALSGKQVAGSYYSPTDTAGTISTRAYRQKGIDSLAAAIATALAGKQSAGTYYGPADTTGKISTRAYRQKGIDSLAAVISAALAGKQAAGAYYAPTDTAGTISTRAYRQKGIDSLAAGIATALAGKQAAGSYYSPTDTAGTISTRAYRQKGIDSLAAAIATALAGKQAAGAYYAPTDTAGTISTRAYRQKGIDSLASAIATALAGKQAAGTYYGPADTTGNISTRAYRQKGIDSLAAVISAALAGKQAAGAYYAPTDTAGSISTRAYRQKGIDSLAGVMSTAIASAASKKSVLVSSFTANTGQSEVYIAGTGIGSNTFPASSLTTGKVIRFRVSGQIYTAASPGQITANIYFGSTKLTTNFLGLPSSLSGYFVWQGNAIVITYSGGNAQLLVDARLDITSQTAGTTVSLVLPPSIATVDNTANHDFNLSTQFGSPGNQLYPYQYLIEFF